MLMEYEVTEEIVTSSRRLGYSPNLFYIINYLIMYEMYERSTNIVYTVRKDIRQGILEAIVTNSSSDYNYWPEVQTLTITLTTGNCAIELYYKQLVDDDFSLTEVDKVMDNLSKALNIKL